MALPSRRARLADRCAALTRRRGRARRHFRGRSSRRSDCKSRRTAQNRRRAASSRRVRPRLRRRGRRAAQSAPLLGSGAARRLRSRARPSSTRARVTATAGPARGSGARRRHRRRRAERRRCVVDVPGRAALFTADSHGGDWVDLRGGGGAGGGRIPALCFSQGDARGDVAARAALGESSVLVPAARRLLRRDAQPARRFDGSRDVAAVAGADAPLLSKVDHQPAKQGEALATAWRDGRGALARRRPRDAAAASTVRRPISRPTLDRRRTPASAAEEITCLLQNHFIRPTLRGSRGSAPGVPRAGGARRVVERERELAGEAAGARERERGGVERERGGKAEPRDVAREGRRRWPIRHHELRAPGRPIRPPSVKMPSARRRQRPRRSTAAPRRG